MPKHKHVVDDGVTFVFKYEETDPTILHIFARHLMEPEDAINTWFDGTPAWNAQYQRWETYHTGIGIYWFWIDEVAEVVMIISCFNA